LTVSSWLNTYYRAEEKYKAATEASSAIHNARANRPPDAPLKTAWPEFLFKRLVREAAEKIMTG
jgi:hypothetical protein